MLLYLTQSPHDLACAALIADLLDGIDIHVVLDFSIADTEEISSATRNGRLLRLLDQFHGKETSLVLITHPVEDETKHFLDALARQQGSRVTTLLDHVVTCLAGSFHRPRGIAGMSPQQVFRARERLGSDLRHIPSVDVHISTVDKAHLQRRRFVHPDFDPEIDASWGLTLGGRDLTQEVALDIAALLDGSMPKRATSACSRKVTLIGPAPKSTLDPSGEFPDFDHDWLDDLSESSFPG